MLPRSDRQDPRRHAAGCPASSEHWLLTPALRNLSRRVVAGRVLHRTGPTAGGWGGRGGREPTWGGGRRGVWGSQPALTSQWWRQVSTINIAHRIRRGLGQRLWQQQGAGGAGLAWESPPGSHNSHPSPVPAGSRRSGPAFLTATSDGPLAHRASYLPREPGRGAAHLPLGQGQCLLGWLARCGCCFPNRPSAAFPLLVPSQSQSPCRGWPPRPC